MKKFLQALLVVALLGATYATADVKKGQKVYLKVFKARFHKNGAKFAAEHTMAEWKALFANKGEMFIKVYSKKSPKVFKVLHKKKIWKKLQHLRDFVIEYANDSGNVPSCG